ncbi:MAG: phosphoribosylformylglycinamidine synthase [Candidatus Cloacimonadota bacterium]|nr:MAG: phosphoribosylformylglycinamidine synthase [Candidatus Cloacimonadota bacterium]PIE78821.1 MAG: phosphoribosylformylglycinamidine synthase [Candidatus Delongbacteria bacterium]
MSELNRVSVITKTGNPKVKGVVDSIQSFLGKDIEELKIIKNFYIEGCSLDETKKIAKEIISCPVTEDYKINNPFFEDFSTKIEIGYQTGVMNPEAETLKSLLMDREGFKDLYQTETYCFKSKLDSETRDLIKNKILMNSQIEQEITEEITSLSIDIKSSKAEIIPIRAMSDKELMKLSDYSLFLTLEEMQTIKNYFLSQNRDPFDVELETLAQTWSEHCGHKTFKAKVIYNGEEKPSMFSLVKDSEKAINHPDIISKFSDNSGVFRFDDIDGEEYGICIKAETHNSPSGLDPYGGAMTGTGGVLRDIAGTGKGAKNISSINIFCLGDPDISYDEVMPGCLHPRRILNGVIEGVRDYGNRMGIPTNNGSFHFHKDFGPKPTVLVGADGIVPTKYAKKGVPQKGELLVSFGGRTGKDGIHGATFSSAEMTEKTSTMNSGAVQIGNAIEEKRTFDCLMKIRDEGVITAMTDCGAGGYSSAAGEMGEDTGVKVYLDKIPLKYPGLKSFEKWISESQERMVAAFKAENLELVQRYCDLYNVELSVIGEFTDTKKLEIFDGEDKVCDLDMDFLHNGQPTETIFAKSVSKKGLKDPEYYEKEINYEDALRDILSHLNVCSKEPVIRQYDHGVQGMTVDGPLCGKENDGPTGAAILKPLEKSDKALILGHGINPVLNRIDSVKGPLWSFYEAMSNVVALGGDPERIFMIENYIWPKPTEENTADLYDCVYAVTEASKFFKTPIISGKDSLSSTYKNGDTVIEVPPVICMSARAVSDDYRKTISPDFKRSGNPILLIGDYNEAAMGGSIFNSILGELGTKVPYTPMAKAKEIYSLIYKHINSGDIISCSDVSEGGMITAVTEMAIGGKKGYTLFIDSPVITLFSEVPAAFVAEVKSLDVADRLIESGYATQIGTITNNSKAVVKHRDEDLINLDMSELEELWKKPMKKYFK